MSDPDGARRLVAAELERLCVPSGPLASRGTRATVSLTDNYTAAGHPTRARRLLRRAVIDRYLARQTSVRREGRAALLTAGPPGSGKTTSLDQLGLTGRGWRRLDADLVKDYLVEEASGSGRYDDLLARRLADGYPIMPAELAPLTHIESVSILDDIRAECLRRGENVVIEGTLGWAPYGLRLLDDLLAHEYRHVRLVDIEVTQYAARENALRRWWSGRHEHVSTGRGLGGRYTPITAIDRLFPDPRDTHSVCAANARAVFDSDAAQDVPTITLTVHDLTSGHLVATERERHRRPRADR